MDAIKALKLIEKNIIRPNRFLFNLNIPSISELQKYNNKNNKDIFQVYINDAKIPGVSLTIKEAVYLGRIKQAIVKQTIEGITITYYDTKEQLIRNFFTDWNNAITPKNDYKTLRYYPNQYSTSASVNIENTNINIKGMIPASIGDFNLIAETNDTIGTFDVIFKVKYCIYV